MHDRVESKPSEGLGNGKALSLQQQKQRSTKRVGRRACR